MLDVRAGHCKKEKGVNFLGSKCAASVAGFLSFVQKSRRSLTNFLPVVAFALSFPQLLEPRRTRRSGPLAQAGRPVRVYPSVVPVVGTDLGVQPCGRRRMRRACGYGPGTLCFSRFRVCLFIFCLLVYNCFSVCMLA